MFRRGFGTDWISNFNFAEGDRVELAAGMTFTVTTYLGQTVLDFGGGDTLGFGASDVAFNASWIVFA